MVGVGEFIKPRKWTTFNPVKTSLLSSVWGFLSLLLCWVSSFYLCRPVKPMTQLASHIMKVKCKVKRYTPPCVFAYICKKNCCILGTGHLSCTPVQAYVHNVVAVCYRHACSYDCNIYIYILIMLLLGGCGSGGRMIPRSPCHMPKYHLPLFCVNCDASVEVIQYT